MADNYTSELNAVSQGRCKHCVWYCRDNDINYTCACACRWASPADDWCANYPNYSPDSWCNCSHYEELPAQPVVNHSTASLCMSCAHALVLRSLVRCVAEDQNLAGQPDTVTECDLYQIDITRGLLALARQEDP